MFNSYIADKRRALIIKDEKNKQKEAKIIKKYHT